MRLAILALLAACSVKEQPRSEPAPATPAKPATPPFDVDEVGRQIVEQAQVLIDASTSACPPATIEKTATVGTMTVSDFGGKRTYNYVGELQPSAMRLGVYASTPPHPVALGPRPRKDKRDFTREYVVVLHAGDHTLDAVSGTLQIDFGDDKKMEGHMVNVDFREVAPDFDYVPNGCTTHIARVDFMFSR